ncbi:peptidase M14 family protein [Candidatus Bathyarchaeota archaeon]|nr:peptidase M14 family protein [Candidatus Bathyarchaeota archaeon]
METQILSPEEFYGFKIGSDKKLVRWDKIIEYFEILSNSPCIKVEEIGKTTMGNPFIVAYISSPQNIQNLDKIREISLKLSHPKGLSKDEIEKMIVDGKTIVSMTMSVHASEIGGTQMCSELAYELATINDQVTQKIRDNAVLVLVPSSNPDGNIMVVDWYNKWLDTEYEGGPLPFLYNKYVGHDNNRDAFHITQAESKMLTKILFKDWYPQAQVDFHHMGSYSARFYIPPHMDPLYEYIDPLVWTEQQLYGASMILELEAAGKKGIETQASYPADGGPYWDESPCMHGICGMLTESASANLASPIFIHKQQLEASRRGRPENRIQMNFPHPWEGGWWKLRDIVEQQKIAAFATLNAASNFRERILRNMVLKAERQIVAGENQPPYAFIISPDQHDELTTIKLLKVLNLADVNIHQANKNFKYEGVTYPKGTYIIFTSQISRPYILRLLKQSYYHDGPWSRRNDGTPLAPYDLASNYFGDFWGVKIIEVTEPIEGEFVESKDIQYPEPKIVSNNNGYLLNVKLNQSYSVINKLLKKGKLVYRILESVEKMTIGSFYIPHQEGIEEEIKALSQQHHISFISPKVINFEKKQLKSLKIGLYQRYSGGNMEEGWLRWLFDGEYNFEYKTLLDLEVKEGKLIEKFDVIIFPGDIKCMITGEGIEEHYRKTNPKYVQPKYPPEFRSGIGKEGTEKIREFVEAGGTLITLSEACIFALEELKLPIRNVIKDINAKEFFCPGSTLKIDIDTTHPLTYGVSKNTNILFKRNDVAFEILNTPKNDDYSIVASYPEEQILKTGWLIGEKYLSNKAAIIEAKYGKGKAILYGFSPISRAMTEATFKFFFNALYK